MLTTNDYLHQLDALLPRGPIWRRREGTLLDSILFAVATEASRIDARAFAIIEENDPRTAQETLQQWFEDWGVPSTCLAVLADPTNEQIRQELLAKITGGGALTAEFFRNLAETLGYHARIETCEAFVCTSTVDKPLYGDEWNTVFNLFVRVNDESQAKIFNTTWTVDQPLAKWGDQLLECLIRSMAPAHVTVIFEYS